MKMKRHGKLIREELGLRFTYWSYAVCWFYVVCLDRWIPSYAFLGLWYYLNFVTLKLEVVGPVLWWFICTTITTLFVCLIIYWDKLVGDRIRDTEWWKGAKDRLSAYRVLAKYIKICPVKDGVEADAFAIYANKVLFALCASATEFDGTQPFTKAQFEGEFYRLHKALKTAGMVESHDWNHYKRKGRKNSPD